MSISKHNVILRVTVSTASLMMMIKRILRRKHAASATCLTLSLIVFKYIHIQILIMTSDKLWQRVLQNVKVEPALVSLRLQPLLRLLFLRTRGAEPRGCFYRALINDDAGEASRCLTCSAWHPQHKRADWAPKSAVCWLIQTRSSLRT